MVVDGSFVCAARGESGDGWLVRLACRVPALLYFALYLWFVFTHRARVAPVSVVGPRSARERSNSGRAKAAASDFSVSAWWLAIAANFAMMGCFVTSALCTWATGAPPGACTAAVWVLRGLFNRRAGGYRERRQCGPAGVAGAAGFRKPDRPPRHLHCDGGCPQPLGHWARTAAHLRCALLRCAPVSYSPKETSA